MYKQLTKKLFNPSFKRHYFWFFNQQNNAAPPIVLGDNIITEGSEQVVDESGFDSLITQFPE